VQLGVFGLSTFIVVMCILTISYLWSKNFWYVSAPLWLALVAILGSYLALPGLDLAFPESYGALISRPSFDSISKTFYINFLGVASFTVGWASLSLMNRRLSTSLQLNHHSSPQFNPCIQGTQFKIFLALQSVGVALYYGGYFFVRGETGHLFRLLNPGSVETGLSISILELLTPIVFLLLPLLVLISGIRAAGGRLFIGYAAFVSILGVTLLSGIRMRFLMLAICGVLVMIMFRQMNNHKHSVTILTILTSFIAILGIIASPMIENLRSGQMNFNPYVTESVATEQEVNVTESVATEQEVKRSISKLLIPFQTIAWSSALVEWSENNEVPIFVSFSDIGERLLLQRKPGERAELLVIIDSLHKPGTGAAIDSITEIWFNGGYTGLIIVMIFLGLFANYLQSKWAGRNDDLSIVLLGVSCVIAAQIYTRGYLFQTLTLVVPIAISAALLRRILKSNVSWPKYQKESGLVGGRPRT